MDGCQNDLEHRYRWVKIRVNCSHGARWVLSLANSCSLPLFWLFTCSEAMNSLTHSSTLGERKNWVHDISYCRRWVCIQLMTTHTSTMSPIRPCQHASIAWNGLEHKKSGELSRCSLFVSSPVYRVLIHKQTCSLAQRTFMLLQVEGEHSTLTQHWDRNEPHSFLQGLRMSIVCDQIPGLHDEMAAVGMHVGPTNRQFEYKERDAECLRTYPRGCSQFERTKIKCYSP